jgi:hypothetical protein
MLAENCDLDIAVVAWCNTIICWKQMEPIVPALIS